MTEVATEEMKPYGGKPLAKMMKMRELLQYTACKRKAAALVIAVHHPGKQRLDVILENASSSVFALVYLSSEQMNIVVEEADWCRGNVNYFACISLQQRRSEAYCRRILL